MFVSIDQNSKCFAKFLVFSITWLQFNLKTINFRIKIKKQTKTKQESFIFSHSILSKEKVSKRSKSYFTCY